MLSVTSFDLYLLNDSFNLTVFSDFLLTFLLLTNCSEIYRIVSAKTVLSPGDESDVIRPSNLETINVKPTVNTDAVKKQCCNS